MKSTSAMAMTDILGFVFRDTNSRRRFGNLWKTRLAKTPLVVTFRDSIISGFVKISFLTQHSCPNAPHSAFIALFVLCSAFPHSRSTAIRKEMCQSLPQSMWRSSLEASIQVNILITFNCSHFVTKRAANCWLTTPRPIVGLCMDKSASHFDDHWRP